MDIPIYRELFMEIAPSLGRLSVYFCSDEVLVAIWPLFYESPYLHWMEIGV